MLDGIFASLYTTSVTASAFLAVCLLSEVAAAAAEAEAQSGHRHQRHAVRGGDGLADHSVTADHLPHLAHGGLHHFAEVGLLLVFHVVHPFQTGCLCRSLHPAPVCAIL